MRLSRRLLRRLGKSSEFEARYLRENPDVEEAVEAGIFRSGYEHWLNHGKPEGRTWGELTNTGNENPRFITRTRFAAKIFSEVEGGDILEIGPLNMPLIKSKNCSYFDILPTEKLRAKAEREGLNPETVPDIEFWHPNGDLSVIDKKFSAIVSAHCIEHQPDLIQHLIDVAGHLSNSGNYYVVVPDQRFCFDHFLKPSGISDVIRANELQARVPNRLQVLEHLALTTHNDPVRHWAGDHGSISAGLQDRWMMAIEKFENNAAGYFDVHCWQFRSDTFAEFINNLWTLKYIPFRCVELFATAPNNLEFFAVLQKKPHIPNSNY